MKETLLLLPGMMCDQRLFTPQVSALKNDYQIIIPKITSATSMSEMARQVLAQLPESFALAGLSMGGILAMEILRQAPQKVGRLALLDTNPLAELLEVQSNRNRQIKDVRAGGLMDVMSQEMIPRYLSAPNEAISELCQDMAKHLGESAFVNQSLALQSRIDQCGTLASFTGPSLVLMGKHDELCPLDRHQLMNKLLVNSQLCIINNAGHLPCLEQPEQTNAALKQWLEQ